MLGKALKTTVPTKITLTVGDSVGSMNRLTTTSVAKQSLKSNKLAFLGMRAFWVPEIPGEPIT